jgi:hypothetical protein
MSSFDEAFRRASANQQSQDATRRQAVDRRRRGAEAAVPVIQQLLRDFVRRMTQHGVQPLQLPLYPESKRGLFSAKGKMHYSPSGYVLDRETKTWNQDLSSLSLLTPDGQLFRYQNLLGDREEGFVPITADNLMNGDIRLVKRVHVGDAGEVYMDNAYDRLERESVAESLANRAVQLISESSQQR